eukprot:m.36787 g.36787  ORF g.36787 m.36787 type:complete len:856 (+) comp5408_c0_seq3:53-2620(+)
MSSRPLQPCGTRVGRTDESNLPAAIGPISRAARAHKRIHRTRLTSGGHESGHPLFLGGHPTGMAPLSLDSRLQGLSIDPLPGFASPNPPLDWSSRSSPANFASGSSLSDPAAAFGSSYYPSPGGSTAAQAAPTHFAMAHTTTAASASQPYNPYGHAAFSSPGQPPGAYQQSGPGSYQPSSQAAFGSPSQGSHFGSSFQPAYGSSYPQYAGSQPYSSSASFPATSASAAPYSAGPGQHFAAASLPPFSASSSLFTPSSAAPAFLPSSTQAYVTPTSQPYGASSTGYSNQQYMGQQSFAPGGQSSMWPQQGTSSPPKVPLLPIPQPLQVVVPAGPPPPVGLGPENFRGQEFERRLVLKAYNVTDQRMITICKDSVKGRIITRGVPSFHMYGVEELMRLREVLWQNNHPLPPELVPPGLVPGLPEDKTAEYAEDLHRRFGPPVEHLEWERRQVFEYYHITGADVETFKNRLPGTEVKKPFKDERVSTYRVYSSRHVCMLFAICRECNHYLPPESPEIFPPNGQPGGTFAGVLPVQTPAATPTKGAKPAAKGHTRSDSAGSAAAAQAPPAPPKLLYAYLRRGTHAVKITLNAEECRSHIRDYRKAAGRDGAALKFLGNVLKTANLPFSYPPSLQTSEFLEVDGQIFQFSINGEEPVKVFEIKGPSEPSPKAKQQQQRQKQQQQQQQQYQPGQQQLSAYPYQQSLSPHRGRTPGTSPQASPQAARRDQGQRGRTPNAAPGQAYVPDRQGTSPYSGSAPVSRGPSNGRIEFPAMSGEGPATFAPSAAHATAAGHAAQASYAQASHAQPSHAQASYAQAGYVQPGAASPARAQMVRRASASTIHPTAAPDDEFDDIVLLPLS